MSNRTMEELNDTFDEHLKAKAQASPKLVLPTGVDFDIYLKGSNGSGSLFRVSKEEACANEFIFINGREISLLTYKAEIHLKLEPEVVSALSNPLTQDKLYNR